MEETNKDNTPQNPQGESKGAKAWKYADYQHYGHGFGHGIVRIILALVVVLFVFGIGIMVGSFRHGFGHREFNRGGYFNRPYPMTRAYPLGASGRMMQGLSTTTPPAATQK